MAAPPPDQREVMKGWHVDVFGARRGDTPPWSRRPPQIEPEVWVMLYKRQERYRETWRETDPEGFAFEEERRRKYEEEKLRRDEAKKAKRGMIASAVDDRSHESGIHGSNIGMDQSTEPQEFPFEVDDTSGDTSEHRQIEAPACCPMW